MSKSLTKAQIQLKKCQRLKRQGAASSPPAPLPLRYDYDKGEVTTRAIIDDILQRVDD